MNDWDDYEDDGMVEQQEPPEMVDALTGEVLGLPTIDTLIDAYERYRDAEQAARLARLQIIAQLAAAASPRTGGSRTTRLRGSLRRIKLEWPEDAWDQAQLKEAWFAFPQLAGEYLSIASLRVKLREYGKLLRENGPEPFECMKRMLQAANRGPQGTPRIIIES